MKTGIDAQLASDKFRISDITFNSLETLIPLSNGLFAIVDSCDFEAVSRFKWQALYDPKSGTWYAKRSDHGRTIRMHREILNAPQGVEVDHRDGNGLNNSRSNIRLATRSQNLCNRRKFKNNTSGFKGVTWSSTAKKWASQIYQNGQKYYLGYYADKLDAAAAYESASAVLHGEFSQGVTL